MPFKMFYISIVVIYGTVKTMQLNYVREDTFIESDVRPPGQDRYLLKEQKMFIPIKVFSYLLELIYVIY